MSTGAIAIFLVREATILWLEVHQYSYKPPIQRDSRPAIFIRYNMRNPLHAKCTKINRKSSELKISSSMCNHPLYPSPLYARFTVSALFTFFDNLSRESQPLQFLVRIPFRLLGREISVSHSRSYTDRHKLE